MWGMGLTGGEKDDVICHGDVHLVSPAHGRIACLRAAWLYNEALSQQREEKKECGGRENMLSLVTVLLNRCIAKGVERTFVSLWDITGCAHL